MLVDGLSLDGVASIYYPHWVSVRHAACRIRNQLTYDARVSLAEAEVGNRGKGNDNVTGGHRLEGQKERAADLGHRGGSAVVGKRGEDERRGERLLVPKATDLVVLGQHRQRRE